MADERLEVELRHHLGRIDLDVRFSVGRETLALIGASGAGKSSVLLAIAGLLRPDHGRIVGAERPLFDAEKRVDLPPEERRVGLVFQHGALFPYLSVAQNVAFGLHPRARSKRERSERVGEILERFAIAELANSRPDRISGGERQAVAIARALYFKSDLIILDEPTNNLGVEETRGVLHFVRSARDSGHSCIFIAHNIHHVFQVVDRIVILRRGVLVADDIDPKKTTIEAVERVITGLPDEVLA